MSAQEQMRAVSKDLIGRQVTHDVIVRVWSEDFVMYESDLNKHLSSLYRSREDDFSR